ncbi:TPA: hypothetical protein ACRNMW_000336 [Pseudomonas aeruginosa]
MRQEGQLLGKKSLRALPVKTMPHFFGSSLMLEPNQKIETGKTI